jgi:drug/metabolite transporter (DMT)-like permease
MTQSEQHRWRVIVAFLLVYVFWGSTYLGIAIAVRHVPPYLMSGARFTVAGLLMLLYCWRAGRGIRVDGSQLLRLAVIGCLLLSVANVLLAWAELVVPTGLAALIVAVTPLWFLVIDSFVFKGDRPNLKGYLGLALGILGIAILLWPKLMATTVLGRKQFFAASMLIFGSLSWSLGSALSKRWQAGIDPFSASGWQMVIAGLVNLTAAAVMGEFSEAHWTSQAIGAIAYLVVFGSWVGFSAYIWLLQHVSMSKVATYAYVNPVVAVFLGWIVLRERVDGYILAGTAIVVISVALVTQSKVKTRAEREEEDALPACEASAD